MIRRRHDRRAANRTPPSQYYELIEDTVVEAANTAGGQVPVLFRLEGTNVAHRRKFSETCEGALIMNTFTILKPAQPQGRAQPRIKLADSFLKKTSRPVPRPT